MPRVIPSDRLSQLIKTATEVFIAQGYRRTQIEDVAQALGVAKGTIYGSVESKEALFGAALRYADGLEPLPDVSALPLPTPQSGSTVAWLRDRIAREAHDLELTVALERPRVRNARQELTAVLRDLYDRMERNRRAIKLVDRCALDQSDLAGRLRKVEDTAIAARLLLETVAFWAVHRHWDASPRPIAENAVQTTVIDMLVRSLEKE